MKEDADYIYEQAKKHVEWFSKSLPMIASENIISPMARDLMLSEFQDKYAEGPPGDRYYEGNEYVDNVEVKAQELAKELFGVDYADVRPISGTNANQAVLMALGGPDKSITSVDVSDGAHISSAQFGSVGLRGMKPQTYPFDVDEMNIDVEGTKELIRDVEPDVALFGRSVFMFPPPLEELQDVFEEVGCDVWYDGAHVLGLIAGNEFQQPLENGVDVMTGSTHKTLPGPQRGIILANPKSEEMEEGLFYGMFPGVVSNHHLHSMAALGIALAEHEKFGEEYASQIIDNAQALGQSLSERGIEVLCEHKGFTRSHTLAIDVQDMGGGETLVEAMEDANMIANKNLLPWDDVDSANEPSGIRLGTQALTRLGMKESHMDEVAEFIKRIIVDDEDPEKVKKDVMEFRKDFQEIQFCFHEGFPAHKHFSILDQG
ncbi:MAG: serine hydroxymethyltransferase [Candidatus Thermoplasmatota archaeon]|nr:serine hydroxymethyltransferase [Candidatus Thermoplasmatota archaeon]